MGTIKYKGYEGTIEYDADREVLRGKVLFVNDLVTYEASDAKTIKIEFQNAIEDYLVTCKELGRDPQKPCSGQFNVRISPELHRAAVLKAAKANTTLNDIAVRAFESYLNGRSDVKNHITLTVNMGEEKPITAIGTSTSKPVWIGQKNVRH